MDRELEQELEHELSAELGESTGELEGEFGELEGEQGEYEGELGELEGEFGELEGELEGEGELGELEGELGEHENGEQFLGGLLKGVGSMFGLGENELEQELESALGEQSYSGEHENEFELGEYEQGEQFFGSILKGIGGLARRAAPMLQQVARRAAPAIMGQVGQMLPQAMGALGGRYFGSQGQSLGQHAGRFAANQMGNLVNNWLREAEHEYEGEFELGEMGEFEATAELMANAAARADNEYEAEAFVGAATALSISRADRAALRKALPHMIRANAILAKLLRKRRATRVFVRVIPAISRSTVAVLRRSGRPITPKRIAIAVARQAARTLGSPRRATTAVARSVKAARQVQKARRSSV